MKYQSKWGELFYARLISQTLTKGQIQAFCTRYSQLVNRTHCRGVAYEDRKAAGDEARTLDSAIAKLRPRCLPEHEESGLAFLYGIAFTPRGALRNTDKAKDFTQYDTDFLQDCKLLGGYEIRFVGTRFVGSRVLPQFEVLLEDKLLTRTLVYTMQPWQSGGYFEVIDHV